MTRVITNLTSGTVAALLLCACAQVESGDANRVSIVGGEFTSKESIVAAAEKHCWLYRKTPELLMYYTLTITIFRCR